MFKYFAYNFSINILQVKITFWTQKYTNIDKT